jgi:acetate---CoA ligase (ADP-forming)
MTGLAVIGASERTLWTYWLITNLGLYGYRDEIWPVNPNRREMFGLRCYPDLDELPGTPDIGVIVVRPDLAVPACKRLVEMDVHTVVVISNGFREAGSDLGARAEEELVECCRGAGVRLIGPNCAGYASFHDDVCAIAEPIPFGLHKGDVTLLSHSGAMISAALGALDLEGLGIDHCYSIGNGASFDLTTALEAAAKSSMTRVVCAVVETLPERKRLEDLLAKRTEDHKEYLFLLLGQSEGGRKVAQSHTGAVLGEQRLTRAWLDRLGITVTTSVEELARAASLVRVLGRPKRERSVFVVAGSGGGAGLAADLAERHGVPLAQISERTRQQIEAAIPPGAYAGNPLDMVAGITSDNRNAIFAAICTDPSVGVLVQPYTVPWPDESAGYRWHRIGLEDFAHQASKAGIPAVVSSLFADSPTPWMQELARRTGIVVAGEIGTTMSALAQLYGTEAPRVRRLQPIVELDTSAAAGAIHPEVIAEAEGRTVLEGAGLPVARGVVVDDEQGAVDATADLSPPWVVKIALPGVGHKGRVNGVMIGLCNETDIRAACNKISSAAVGAGLVDRPTTVRFLVQEMLIGPEVLVGAVRDEVTGPSLTVAPGGWAAEAGVPFGIIQLPATKQQIAAATSDWALRHLLGEERETQLVEFLTALANEFYDGHLSSYTVVEINPVVLGASGARAADVLIVP